MLRAASAASMPTEETSEQFDQMTAKGCNFMTLGLGDGAGESRGKFLATYRFCNAARKAAIRTGRSEPGDPDVSVADAGAFDVDNSETSERHRSDGAEVISDGFSQFRFLVAEM
jgi:hypothetical protein